MLRRASLAAGLAISLLLSSMPAARAVSGVVCTYDAASHDLVVQGPVGPGHVAVANLRREASGGFSVNHVACDAAATVDTVARVVIAGTTALRLSLDEGDGPFAPGFGAEPGGSPEIEITFQGTLGAVDLTVRGTHGNDRMLAGTDGIDLNGDGDADVAETDLGALTLEGRSGDDVLSTLGSEAAGEPLLADATLDGGAGADTIRQADLDGSGRSASLVGGPGRDTIDGSGARTSVLDLSGAQGGVRVDLREGTSRGEGTDRIRGISTVVGSPFGDKLVAGGGKAYFAGGAGNDILAASRGGGSFDGGPGRDIVSYGKARHGVHVSLAAMRANWGPAIAGFEAVIGSRLRDVLVGDGRPNMLYGGGGDDDLFGGPGADHLRGGPGSDRLDGGHDIDVCRQGAGHGTKRRCEI